MACNTDGWLEAKRIWGTFPGDKTNTRLYYAWVAGTNRGTFPLSARPLAETGARHLQVHTRIPCGCDERRSHTAHTLSSTLPCPPITIPARSYNQASNRNVMRRPSELQDISQTTLPHFKIESIPPATYDRLHIPWAQLMHIRPRKLPPMTRQPWKMRL